MQKTKKLLLAYTAPHLLYPDVDKSKLYQVTRVHHSTEYNPGDLLTKAEVDSLTVSRHWDITIVAASK